MCFSVVLVCGLGFILIIWTFKKLGKKIWVRNDEDEVSDFFIFFFLIFYYFGTLPSPIYMWKRDSHVTRSGRRSHHTINKANNKVNV